MKRERETLWGLVLVLTFIALMVLALSPPSRAQDSPCQLTKSAQELKQPDKIFLKDVQEFGCFIKADRHTVMIFNLKTKKSEPRETFTEYYLTLRLRDAEGKIIWKFEPAPYSDEMTAYMDCANWKIEMKKAMAQRDAK